MITKFLLQLRILPRWVIILLDLFIVAFSTFLGYLLRFNFNLEEISQFGYSLGILVNTLACFLALFITKSYAGIVRYTGLKDGLRVLNTLLITHLLTTFTNLLYHYNFGENFIPYSVILISFLASFVFMFQYRLLIKNIFSYYRQLSVEKKNVAIFGAGQMGIITKHLLDDDPNSQYKVVAFFEDDANKVGKEINGTIIYSTDKLGDILSKLDVKELIIAIQQVSIKRKNEIVDLCLNYNTKVRTVPSLDKWVKGELSLSQIKEIKIDDLLERDSIQINNELVIEQIRGKRVMITGAAGSIGSELVQQLFAYQPKELILIDQSESALYELFRDLDQNENKRVKISTYVADITDFSRIRSIFNQNKPQVVYHAAAYKHVPFMEDHVVEAVRCNIMGTRQLADLSVEVGAEKFVMISTDKAVNPTNVMGCTKRVAEIYVQSLNSIQSSTKFITTRFGNVLGSNGSVIPYFKKQISNGGPVTVTHPDITRFFMTISEACELVIEAGAMGNGGEIFLFDMGRSVKIVDLAKKMIRLSGFEPYKEIDIVFSGLRKGEKLFEELLANKENTLPTHHEKILIAKVKEYSFENISDQIEEMLSLLNLGNYNEELDFALVKIMKRIVPEYKSKSSKFTQLDSVK